VQGSYEDLVRQGSLSPETSNFAANHESEDDKIEAQDLDDIDETMFEEDVAKAKDLKQPGSDIAVYKYYFQAVGPVKLLVFISFVILNVFSGTFSSM
jgi:hypothetical protein